MSGIQQLLNLVLDMVDRGHRGLLKLEAKLFFKDDHLFARNVHHPFLFKTNRTDTTRQLFSLEKKAMPPFILLARPS